MLKQQREHLKRVSPSLHEDAVVPDGVPIVVEWSKLQIGNSVFIPAINQIQLKQEVKKISERKGYTLKGFSRIEAGKYGMRFWRIL